MYILITYDINTETAEGRKRLRHIAKICCNHGQRVQNSVFECLVEPAQWVELKSLLESEFDPLKDSLRYYYLGSNWQHRVEHKGAKPSYDPEGPIII